MKININGKVVELSNEDLKSALDSNKESIDLTVDDIIIRTSDEDLKFKENTQKEGIAIGTQLGRKDVVKGLGIELEGVHKTDESTIEALKEWNSKQISTALEGAKIEPNKQIEEKEKDIQTLKQTIESLQGKYEAVQGEFTGYKKQQTITSTLSTLIPDNVILPKSDMMTLISTKIKTDVDENGRVVAIGQDGQVIKDTTTLEPLPIEKVVTSFFDENQSYLKPIEGGSGGSDSQSGVSKQNVDQFIEEMRGKGITPNSEEFNNEMNDRVKNGLLEV